MCIAFCYELLGSAAKPRKLERFVSDPVSAAGSDCGEVRGWQLVQGGRTLQGKVEGQK